MKTQTKGERDQKGEISKPKELAVIKIRGVTR